MIQALLSQIVPAPQSPTADLYFMNACADFLGAGVTRAAPTVFVSDAACLVMRHHLGIGRLPDRRRLIYFTDDAVERGAGDAGLPLLYRHKLRLVDCAAARRMAPRAEVAVVSSEALAAPRADGIATRVIHPYWSEPVAGGAHFLRALRREGWIDVAFLGSIVHRGDLAFLWPVVVRMLARHPRVRFHLPERHRLPEMLAGHPRVRPIPGRDWAGWRAGVRSRRFHIALYPLLDTPFNRARSVNKLIEHAIAGAAPLYSRAWPEAARAGAEQAGLVLANDPAAWSAALDHLIETPEAARALAEGAARLARRLNDPGPQRALWSELLGLAPDAAG